MLGLSVFVGDAVLNPQGEKEGTHSNAAQDDTTWPNTEGQWPSPHDPGDACCKYDNQQDGQGDLQPAREEWRYSNS
jgi:hypothetical protein